MGQIVSTHTDDSGTRAVVEVESVAVCERCESGRGCGAGLIGRESRDRRIEAIVVENLEVAEGDRVNVVLEPRHILRASIIVYGYPLGGAVFAAMLAFGVGLSDIAGAIAALVGIASGVCIARYRLRSKHCLREFTPVIVDRLPLVSD